MMACQTKQPYNISYKRVSDRISFNADSIKIEGDLKPFDAQLYVRTLEDGVKIIKLKMSSLQKETPPELSLKWKIPSADINGFWTPKITNDKANYSGGFSSNISSYAPVLCYYDASDNNRFTLSCSDALNRVNISSYLNEEDACFHFEIKLFSERMPGMTDYEIKLRIDTRSLPYYRILSDVSDWWAQMPEYTPMHVPDNARIPIYSTWYSFHQNLDIKKVLNELKVGKKMGLDLVIVDDGWQTKDNRGDYAYTGDWEPDRIPNMQAFVDSVHDIGMKIMLWYSVPFIGKNAKVYPKFKDKYLTYWESQGAYVLDPRYPEVREHIINTYQTAMTHWNLDGFKFDFLEWFKSYANTDLTIKDGRDYASVNEATDRLMSDVVKRLTELNNNVLIEFRQPYIGPAMRKYGNMFRALDCANMGIVNRVRVTDIRLLCGNTAPHSDMFMWHKDDPVESAALQMLNILYSVPQVSVLLNEITKDQFEMIQFWIRYWKENRSVLLDGTFIPYKPTALYPAISAQKEGKNITTLYNDAIANFSDSSIKNIDIINAKYSQEVITDFKFQMGPVVVKVFNCEGEVQHKYKMNIKKGLTRFNAPASGMVSISVQ